MKSKNREIQRRIAYEAARIMTEGRFDDQAYAIHKAADRLGINNKRLMPNHEEVESALREQQRLFRGGEQQTVVTNMRSAALKAMTALKQFNPLLVGAAFAGTADKNSRIRLHLHATTPEEVVFSLMELRIPWHERDCSIKFSDGSRKMMPNYSLIADGNTFELIILPDTGLHNRPLDPQDNRPIKGMTIQQLERMLTQR
jgi:hypothetical protein